MYEHLVALDDMHKRADSVLEGADVLMNKMKDLSVRYFSFEEPDQTGENNNQQFIIIIIINQLPHFSIK